MEARNQLLRVVSDPTADPAEVALAVTAFHDRELDVATQLLRVDALADLVRTTEVPGEDVGPPVDAPAALRRMRAVLGDTLGFRGEPGRTRVADDAHLHVVLDQHHGLPVTLSALYVAVARRLGVNAFVVNLPGHVVAALDDNGRPLTFDPFAGGATMDEAALTTLVHNATGGHFTFTRALVRPATAAELARRILANLTVDLSREQNAGAALWTVVARLSLPNADPRDHLVLASLLERSGRFDRAAQAYDRYLDALPEAADADEVRAQARAARARTN